MDVCAAAAAAPGGGEPRLRERLRDPRHERLRERLLRGRLLCERQLEERLEVLERLRARPRETWREGGRDLLRRDDARRVRPATTGASEPATMRRRHAR